MAEEKQKKKQQRKSLFRESISSVTKIQINIYNETKKTNKKIEKKMFWWCFYLLFLQTFCVPNIVLCLFQSLMYFFLANLYFLESYFRLWLLLLLIRIYQTFFFYILFSNYWFNFIVWVFFLFEQNIIFLMENDTYTVYKNKIKSVFSIIILAY